MIVKNESDYIKQCIEPLLSICDDIIIADTGSTDQTVEIATQYATKMIDLPPIHNFSEARNIVFDHFSRCRRIFRCEGYSYSFKHD